MILCSSEANSGASYVIDRHKIERPIQSILTTQLDPTQAIIYELSVRDSPCKRSWFPRLLESPKRPDLGFDYLKSLGITYVQLMPPSMISGSVDETNPTAGR